MIMLVIGGSGSGKSAFAEDCATSFSNNLLYIATMQPFGVEADHRIQRHLKMRENKGFISLDCYTDLENVSFESKYDVILLECMSNLLANELYQENAENSKVIQKITKGIKHLQSNSKTLIIVSNDIGADINGYSIQTMEYINQLGELNCIIATQADAIIEVVCGIPIYHKGERQS